MATNRRIVPSEDSPDFYRTPTWATEALLRYEGFTTTILEPCCGDGAMAEVLHRNGHVVIASDLHARGYGAQVDFFRCTGRFPNIITNPPFNIAEQVLMHALELAVDKVALLLRTAFLEGGGRYERIYSKRPPVRVWIFSERVSMYPAGQERAEGGTTSYAWFVWDQLDMSGETRVRWIPPGLKPNSRFSKGN